MKQNKTDNFVLDFLKSKTFKIILLVILIYICCNIILVIYFWIEFTSMLGNIVTPIPPQ